MGGKRRPPIKKTATFEQAPNGTFFAFTKMKKIIIKQLTQYPKLEKEKKKIFSINPEKKKKSLYSAWCQN